MFTLSKHRDKVTILPTEPNTNTAIKTKLLLKYCNRKIDQSICISIRSIITIHSLIVVEGYLIADTTFELITFTFFEDEILQGTLISQDSEQIVVSIPFFNNIKIPKSNLPEPNERRCINKDVVWSWYFNEEAYNFRNGASVRVKIVKVEKGMNVIGTVNGQGLGLLEWWE